MTENTQEKDKKIVIKVSDLQKIYELYPSKNARFKEALSFTHKNYHTNFYALDDINFQVTEGECYGIIGKNGSGKSTLLKILTGVLSETKGTVEIDGRISALLELGAGFNPEYSGIENIYLNGDIMGYTRDEMNHKIDDIIAFADIGDHIHQPVKTYSSGMF
ncbi:MAG: ABC transporter ATP-binding protein, partial [Eubacteriaceae bacterium]